MLNNFVKQVFYAFPRTKENISRHTVGHKTLTRPPSPEKDTIILQL